MEKICIVKRRRPIQEGAMSLDAGTDRTRSPLLTIELTGRQAEIVRSNVYFQQLNADKAAPVFLNIHFGAALTEKMRTAREVCSVLQVSRHTLDRLVKEGRIRSYRIGRLRRFSAEDVMDYLAGAFDGRSKDGRGNVGYALERAIETH